MIFHLHLFQSLPSFCSTSTFLLHLISPFLLLYFSLFLPCYSRQSPHLLLHLVLHLNLPTLIYLHLSPIYLPLISISLSPSPLFYPSLLTVTSAAFLSVYLPTATLISLIFTSVHLFISTTLMLPSFLSPFVSFSPPFLFKPFLNLCLFFPRNFY